MIKEAIEKIEAMAKPVVHEIDGHTYMLSTDGTYVEILPDIPLPAPINLSSLDAVITMIKTEAIKTISPVFVSVPTATSVEVFSKAMHDKRENRIIFYKAKATDVPGWDPSTKLAFEQAAVALQTRFQDGGDREYCLQLLSNITTGAKVTYNDTGVATTVVTQKGVALQENQKIRPLVKLRPYRTFQEVEQPEGLFLIRIDERGITFTEADGGMWKLTARKTVVDYLKDALAAEIEHGDIKVML
jgi:hypothetical protein